MSTDPDSQQEVSNPEASQQPDQGDKCIDKKADGVADPSTQEKQNPNASSELIVLSPHYDEKHHGLYVEKLEQAVRNPKVRNIALTGGYGTGKSSVIQGLVERIRSSEEDEETNKSHDIQRLIEKIRPSKNPKKIRPIIISLPTIQVVNESAPENDRTDRIQREIVKQLLYRSDPRKMRGSQYRRITHVTVAQRATVCFIVAAILTFAFWSLAKPDWHWHWSQGGSLWGYWQPAMVQTILWGLTFYIDWIWVNKPALKGLQLGPAKLELEKNDSSYFDKYLNEIIYYFKVSETNLVIFEDLDRLDNPYIFDALHELNELINISLGQERFTEQKNPPIKFLYTTRDSIFEHKTKGIIKDNNTRYAHQLEIENRTKFFDVIVPLLPFSTSYNAYEYLTQLLNDSNFPIEIKIDRELQDIVSSSISDYRLIANIISEFQIFTKQIFDVHGEGRKMTEFFKKHTNHLFAFIAYKNTHLTDYEKMQNGNSNIDKVCTEFSELMISINRISIELFDQIGEKLREYINKNFGPSHHYALVLDDKQFSNYNSIELWEKALHRESCTKEFPLISVINLRGEVVDYLDGDVFSEIMKKSLKHDLRIGDKERKDPNYLLKVINNIDMINDIDSLKSYFSLEDTLTTRAIQEKITSFNKIINNIVDHDKMLLELLKSNYIDRNFYIYTSTFMELFENENVLNFLMKNVEKRLPEVDFRLNDKETREIVYRLKKNQYSNLEGALNADLMLYLESQAEIRELEKLEERILHHSKYVFNAQEIGTIVKLNIEILHRIDNDSDPYYKHAQKLLEKILSLHPDSLDESFNADLTKSQKILLISAATGLDKEQTQKYFKEILSLHPDSLDEFFNAVQKDSQKILLIHAALDIGAKINIEMERFIEINEAYSSSSARKRRSRDTGFGKYLEDD
jgi:hypothetical protein